jgi:hypothetical protein
MLPAPIASSNGSGGGNRLINTVVFGADTSQQVFCRSTNGCGSTIGNGHDGSARRMYNASYSQPLVLGWGRAGVDVQATTCDSALCDAHHVPVID